ncbi:uncharacterized protein LOC132700111 [Cylas formicarius]|uniref:uncharacterized protein LOC132700111 n=1 Tax=Cylas formicarius TaxID=197179 RepID=UPI0029588A37|nr:uncharacterized protein LOC132700111 [Cylas formicarius]
MIKVAFAMFVIVEGCLAYKGHHHAHRDRDRNSPAVRAPAGLFQGAILKSRLGRDIYSFRGIRYAKAPIGELRFKPPVPIETFEGTYNATQYGAICPQPATGDPMSEDCLLLNVFTTKLPGGRRKSVKRPVIVYIHSGGFYFMSSSWFGPQYFMDQDIVLVTINYRLQTLGFLATGDELSPGNNGLKDQVLALKWIQSNIESFGGDPNAVTLLGCSAGAISVVSHMISPMSKGLFHRGIALSDSVLAQWDVPHDQMDLAKRQARFVGCPDTSSSEIIDCLKTKSAKELGQSLLQFGEYDGDPLLIWKPVVERDFGQERFFLEHPVLSVQKGDFYKVPFITGITAEEFSYKAMYIVNNETLLNEMNGDWDRVAPISFLYERNTSRSKSISAALKKFYFNDRPIDKSSEGRLGELYADSTVGFSGNRAIKLISDKSPELCFYYRFSYPGRYSFFYLPNTNNKTYGVVHHDDLIYLFYYPKLFPLFGESTPKEVEMVKTLTGLYATFAKYGNPTPPGRSPTNVVWEPYDKTTQKYLDIGSTLEMKTQLYEDRYAIWEKLFPLMTTMESRRMFVISLFVVLYEISIGKGDGNFPVVTTPLGKIQGSLLKSRLGKTIYSFRGIRYAQPPIGELRFQPPVPITSYEGVYNATVDGYLCPQPSDDPTSEDCLILNVYTTKLPNIKLDVKHPVRPVMVYLHAGGWYSVGSTSKWAGPQYFMDQKIVLVTLNYRLATLGFLATGEREAPGNNGMKDQIQALKWIQQNIRAFGGDPDSVTLMGYSAGGMSVIFHMVSPMSKGLFHRGIAMSGSPTAQWPIKRDQLELARKQARLVGCPDDSPADIVECLKTKSADELGNSLPSFAEFNYDPVLIWTPVIEKDFGQERFLTDHPIELILADKFYKIPFIAGVTTHEFSYRAYNVFENSTSLRLLNEEWERIAPTAFIYERDTRFSNEVSAGLKSFYFRNKTIDRSLFDSLGLVYADSVIGFGVNRAIKLISSKNDKGSYYYKFSYKGRYSHFTDPDTNKTIGPVHHDDLIYLLYIEKLFPFFNESFPEIEMVDNLTSLYSSFAKFGFVRGTWMSAPVNSISRLRVPGAAWESFSLDTQKYMDIGDRLTMRRRLYDERYLEWEKLFPLSLYKEN